MTAFQNMSRPPPKKITSWDVARVLVGCLLLVSASLKLHSLLTQSLVTSNEWLASPRVQWLAVGWESSLALWLFSGCRANVTSWVTLATFSIFAVVSLHEAAAGKRTCCCFGAVQAQPWFVFTMDVGIVTFLYRVQPNIRTRSKTVPLLRTATITLAVIFLATGITAAFWYTPPALTLQVFDWPDTAIVVKQGARVEWEFRFYNPGPEVLQIERIDSSCDCFSVSVKETTLSPNRFVVATAVVDLSSVKDANGDFVFFATSRIDHATAISLKCSVIVEKLAMISSMNHGVE